METGSTRVHVMINDDGSWQVIEPGSARPLKHADTQANAVRDARTLLGSRGGELRVFGAGGQLEATEIITPRGQNAPWWYLPHWKWMWIIGIALGLQGILFLSNDLRDWLSWLTAVAGSAITVAVYASWRRDRQLSSR